MGGGCLICVALKALCLGSGLCAQQEHNKRSLWDGRHGSSMALPVVRVPFGRGSGSSFPMALESSPQISSGCIATDPGSILSCR